MTATIAQGAQQGTSKRRKAKLARARVTMELDFASLDDKQPYVFYDSAKERYIAFMENDGDLTEVPQSLAWSEGLEAPDDISTTVILGEACKSAEFALKFKQLVKNDRVAYNVEALQCNVDRSGEIDKPMHIDFSDGLRIAF